MLLKVERIQEIGRFSTLRHKAPQFGRLSLIFARNGYGKSTLCSVLRSATEQDVLQIASRRRLGAVKESVVQIEWQSAGAVVFSAGKWNSSPGHIYLFDAEYIRRNIHVADSVTRDNKRNLIPVVLGDYGVQLAEMISVLDAEQRECVSAQNAAEKIIKVACPGVTDINAFAEAAIPEDIDDRIQKAVHSLELARQSLAVKAKSDPLGIEIRPFSAFEQLAQKSLDGVAEEASTLVKEHINAHSMHPNGARWLRYGVEHMKEGCCPFCTQDTSSVPIVSVFKTYFSAAYAGLISEIESALAEIVEIYGDDGERFAELVDGNSLDFEFWKSVCDIGTPLTLNEEDQKLAKDSLKSLKQVFECKAKNPLSQPDIDNNPDVASGFQILLTYAAEVKKVTKLVQAARSEIGQVDVLRAQEILQKNKALKTKLSNPVAAELIAWKKCAARRSEIEVEKKQAQDKLRSHLSSNVGDRQNAINALLEQFGANFKIENTKASFVGREASADFSIAIGVHSVKAGEIQKGEPSFATVLSAGDKFTLALAFFISQVRSDAELSKALIVFDDPFNSQDAQRQWETTSQIRALAAEARQVIVLSHDARFLKLIEKNVSVCSTFQIVCDDAGIGSISTWSSEEELKEIYVRQAERIREYAATGELLKGSTHENLIKDLRPFLEDFIRARFPGRFGSLVMLDDMAKQIEAVGLGDPLFKCVSAFRAINEYSRDSMHGGASIPDPGQLRAQCKRIVSIIGSY